MHSKLAEEVIKVGDKELVKRKPVADLEITQVEDELSYGKLSGASDKVVKDMKVEEVVQ